MTDDVTNDNLAAGDESATGPGATTLVCSGCEEPIGPKDELVRAFSGNELVPVCIDCLPPEIECGPPLPCCGCGRLVRYERSQHRRIHVSCNDECRLLGFSRRRLESAARARRKDCAHCGVAYQSRRRDGRFCGDPCRKRAHRTKQARQGTGQRGADLSLQTRPCG